MEPLLQTMQDYNKAMRSYERADVFFAREDISLEQKLSRENDCKILVNHLNGLINKIADVGYTMTDEEIDKGFRQIEVLYPTKEA